MMRGEHIMSTQQKARTAYIIDNSTLSLFEKISLAVLGSVFLVLSAKMMVPFWPVPMTFQSLAVIMIGVVLGPRLGLAAVMAYLAEGFVGLNVYADTVSYPGLSVLTRPSAGFLMSFPITAFVAGMLAKQGWTDSWLKSLGLFAISYVIMYTIGMAWFANFFGMEIAFQNMWLWVPGELAKIGLGITSIQAFNSYRNRGTKCD